MYDVQIKGLQRLQKKYLEMVNNIKPSTGLGRAVKRVIVRSHDYAVRVTHVDTGALRASHIIDLVLKSREVVGTLEISRGTVNPKHGERPYKYGIVEHDRGGGHAFYHRTFFNETLDAARDALRHLSNDADKPFKRPW